MSTPHEKRGIASRPELDSSQAEGLRSLVQRLLLPEYQDSIVPVLVGLLRGADNTLQNGVVNSVLDAAHSEDAGRKYAANFVYRHLPAAFSVQFLADPDVELAKSALKRVVEAALDARSYKISYETFESRGSTIEAKDHDLLHRLVEAGSSSPYDFVMKAAYEFDRSGQVGFMERLPRYANFPLPGLNFEQIRRLVHIVREYAASVDVTMEQREHLFAEISPSPQEEVRRFLIENTLSSELLAQFAQRNDFPELASDARTRLAISLDTHRALRSKPVDEIEALGLVLMEPSHA